MMRKTLLCTVALLCSGFPLPAHADEVDSQGLVSSIENAAKLWRSSCLAANADESCRIEKRVRRAHSCQVEVEELRVGKRSAKARRAQKRLRQSLLALTIGGETGGPQGALAEARYLIAEASFEAFLAIRPPRGLNFDPRNPKRAKRSSQAFLEFFNACQARAEETTEAFAEVVAMPNTPATRELRLAALAQSSRVYRHFAQLLYAMEVPRDLRSGPYKMEAEEAFCDALSDKALAMEQRAQQTAQVCLALADGGTPSRWSARCEAYQQPIGALSDDKVVRRIIQSKRSAFEQCHRDASRDEPGLAGEMSLSLQVDDKGQVVHSEASGLEGREFRSCLSAAAADLVFPAANPGTPTTIHYPLRFTARN